MTNRAVSSRPAIALAVAILACSAAGARQQTQEPSDPVPPEEADVSITGSFSARELTVEVVPEVTVEFPGSHERRTEWVTERRNLPDRLEPGVTYRDVGMRLKIVVVFADIERIVAEALGEAATDEGATRDASPGDASPGDASPGDASPDEPEPASPPPAPPQRRPR